LVQVLAPTTAAGIAALSAAFVDAATGDLRWQRLAALLSDPTKGRGRGPKPSPNSPSAADASAFVAPLAELLLEPQDGKALRRLVHSELKTEVREAMSLLLLIFDFSAAAAAVF
jgi:hypothetical protein